MESANHHTRPLIWTDSLQALTLVPANMMDLINIPDRAVFTCKQKDVFRDLFAEAKNDIIFGRWIAQVGMERAVQAWATGTSGIGGLSRDLVCLAINSSAMDVQGQSDDQHAQPSIAAFPAKNFTGNNVKRTRKLVNRALSDPIFSVWMQQSSADDLRAALRDKHYPEFQYLQDSA